MALQDAKPFLGVVVLQETSATANWKMLLMSVMLDLSTDANDRDAALTVLEDQDFGTIVRGAHGVIQHCEERRPVAWLPVGAGVFDQLNHLLVALYKRPYLFIHVSDGVLRSRIERLVGSGTLVDWKRVPQSTLVWALVGRRPLKALWLQGAHRPVTVKPSSKVLAGSDLRDAIDPFGDTTFSARAVRSDEYGVSLRKSGVWRSRSKDWATFNLQVDDLATRIGGAQQYLALNPGERAAVHAGLATPVESLTGVAHAYHVQWADPETIGRRSTAELISKLRDEYQVELLLPAAGAPPTSTARVSFEDGAGTQVVVNLLPTLVDADVSFTAALSAGATHPAVEAIKGDSSLLNIYYDSGHSIVGGSLSIATLSDRPCECLEYHDFENFTPGTSWEYDKEKPAGWPTTTANLFSATDKSLFVWIYRNLAALGLAAPNGVDCWLYSDDGSMEVADFVHLHLRPGGASPKITLIHAKPSSTNLRRRVCTGPYELVVAQALKNLRALNAQELIKRIEDRAQNAFTKGEGRVWDSPWAVAAGAPPLVNPAPFLAALGGIGASCEYSVLIVQPHVKRDTYLAAPNSTGAVQLRALFFTASAAANAVMAQFKVIVST